MPFSPDSRTAGYLGPVAPEPIEGNAFEDFLHDVIAGVTGFDNTLVRPRWQEEPPNIPPFGTDWVALGVTEASADFTPVIVHDPAGNGGLGTDELQRHETVTVMCSFYGRNASKFAGWLRDGLFLDQNRAVFRANAVGLVEIQPAIRNAEKFRERWWDRVDLTVVLRRQIRRTYNVMNILRVTGTITSDTGVVSPFDTE
jgi:hypothetical protein